MDDLQIKVDLGEMTLGDLEQLESRSIRDVLVVCDKLIVELNGASEPEQVHATLRNLHWTKLRQVSLAIGKAVEAQANQVLNGKN